LSTFTFVTFVRRQCYGRNCEIKITVSCHETLNFYMGRPVYIYLSRVSQIVTKDVF